MARVILQALHPVFDRARAALEEQLAAVTLQDVADEVARRRAFTTPIAW